MLNHCESAVVDKEFSISCSRINWIHYCTVLLYRNICNWTSSNEIDLCVPVQVKEQYKVFVAWLMIACIAKVKYFKSMYVNEHQSIVELI